MTGDLESTSLVQRVVLCCLVELSSTGATPADTAEIRRDATERLERTDDVGRLAEADVIRALNVLAETDLVEETAAGDRSPVGKGRPRYGLAVDAEGLRSRLSEDPRLESLLE